MKISKLLVSAIFSAALVAAISVRADSKPAAGQETFSSPDDAVNALRAAAESQDESALDKIFGPEIKSLRTGDKVEDANHRAHFARAMAESCQQVKESENRITLDIGATNWPFPIPLIKGADQQWYFDTDEGKEEILNRHIGEDELHAIGVCTAYVEAQRQYASMNPASNGETEYALKFKSSEGKRDGLYWKTGPGETPSPFNELVAQAHAEGYHHNAQGSGSKPFEGYYFRILTRQGGDAPGGKMNYMHHGRLTRGYALVAFPARYDRSGVMTFIVNQEGKVYQRDLGPRTVEIACQMKDYNPDSAWTVVQDEGIYERQPASIGQ